MNMELLARLAFGFYAAVILAGGALAVSSPSLIRAMIGLVTALFGVAGMYLLMDAALVALMQILIYVGAVSVLIFFAIMLAQASPDGDEAAPASLWEYARSGLVFVIPVGVLALTAVLFPVDSLPLPKHIGPEALGQGLLGPYTLAFELISVVLLAAMAGAVLVAFERRKPR